MWWRKRQNRVEEVVIFIFTFKVNKYTHLWTTWDDLWRAPRSSSKGTSLETPNKNKQTNKKPQKNKRPRLRPGSQQCQSASLLQTRTSSHWWKRLRCKTFFPVTKSWKARSTHSCDPNGFWREGAVLQGELCAHRFSAAADEGNILQMTATSPRSVPVAAAIGTDAIGLSRTILLVTFLAAFILLVFQQLFWVLHSKCAPRHYGFLS